MRLVVLVLLCACNNAFGLETTVLVDTPPDTPTIDAPPPPHCPPAGELPRFSDELYSVPAPHCYSYTFGGTTAMAYCDDGIEVGHSDQTLTAMAGAPTDLYDPRLAADGSHLVVRRLNSTQSLDDYELVDGTLMLRTSYPIPTTTGYWEYTIFSTPSAGPDMRVMYSQYSYTTYHYELVELTNTSGTWSELTRYPVTDTGLMDYNLDAPWLSSDGLRMISVTEWLFMQGSIIRITPATVYLERTSLDQKFGSARLLDTVPEGGAYPFMTEDCGRLYFSALNRLYYVKQAPN